MGSFSWNRADNVKKGEAENIYGGCKFKFLIPKEFGGGFIVDTYQDYGYLGSRSKDDPKYDMYELLAFWNAEKVVPMSTSSTVIYKRFEVGETVTLRARDEQLEDVFVLGGQHFVISKVLFSSKKSYDGRVFLLEGVDGLAFTIDDFERETRYMPNPVAGLKFEGDEMPRMPERGIHTSHNRSLGIHLCYPHDGNNTRDGHIACVDGLKYPLKLVSVDFEGTYEDCPNPSYSDPDQGFHPRRRK